MKKIILPFTVGQLCTSVMFIAMSIGLILLCINGINQGFFDYPLLIICIVFIIFMGLFSD